MNKVNALILTAGLITALSANSQLAGRNACVKMKSDYEPGRCYQTNNNACAAGYTMFFNQPCQQNDQYVATDGRTYYETAARCGAYLIYRPLKNFYRSDGQLHSWQPAAYCKVLTRQLQASRPPPPPPPPPVATQPPPPKAKPPVAKKPKLPACRSGQPAQNSRYSAFYYCPNTNTEGYDIGGSVGGFFSGLAKDTDDMARECERDANCCGFNTLNQKKSLHRPVQEDGTGLYMKKNLSSRCTSR